MEPRAKKALKISKNVVLLLIWVVVLIGCIKAYDAYKYWQDNPQTKFERDMFEEPSQDEVIKLEKYRSLQNLIYIGLLLFVVHTILDYYYDPQNHFVVIYGQKVEKYLGRNENE